MKSGFSFEFYEKVFENCFIHISNYVNGKLQLSLFGVNPETDEVAHFTDITLDQNSWEISKNDIVVDCLYNTSFVPQLKELGILKEQTGICPVNNSIYPVYSLNFDKIKELSYEINSNCPYRQKNESGKSACNKVGWFKFLVPSVCKDRIFLMKVTGQTSINTLQTYFDFIKLQGISAKGYYTLCLKQKTQTNSLGNTFNNYVLDILKKEDFIQTNQIPQKTENNEILSTKVTDIVDSVPTKQVENKEKTVVTQVDNHAGTDRKKATSKTKVSKDTTKKETSLVPEDTKVETKNEKGISAKQSEETPKESFENVYGLIKMFYKKSKN